MPTNDDIDLDLKTTPETWDWMDCGFNTAPGIPNRAELKKAIAAAVAAGSEDICTNTVDDRTELYYVRKAVWDQAGMQPLGGCLCIGCLEKRLHRKLQSKDFMRNDPFATAPGTPRLLQRRGRQRGARREQWAQFLAVQERET